jgi:hypothetical protein
VHRLSKKQSNQSAGQCRGCPCRLKCSNQALLVGVVLCQLINRSHPPQLLADHDVAAVWVVDAAVVAARHVDSATHAVVAGASAGRDVAAVWVVDAAVVASRRHVESVTPLIVRQGAEACDTRLAMGCLCAVRRCYTRRKEER